MSFLSRSYERHFNERPYLHHQCYLFLTKTTKERMARQSNFSTLCRGHIVPKEIKDKETVARFLDAVELFTRIINDSGYISLRRLTDEEITGTERTTGLVGKYLSLSTENVQCLEDIELSASGMRIGNKHLCLHTLSQTEDLPTEVSTDNRFERLSTDRSDCRLSFAAPVGLLLSCNHIYNQYVFINNSDETLQKFEKTARNMHSLSRYSRQNAINKEWIDEYLNEAHSQGLQIGKDELYKLLCYYHTSFPFLVFYSTDMFHSKIMSGFSPFDITFLSQIFFFFQCCICHFSIILII